MLPINPLQHTSSIRWMSMPATSEPDNLLSFSSPEKSTMRRKLGLKESILIGAGIYYHHHPAQSLRWITRRPIGDPFGWEEIDKTWNTISHLRSITDILTSHQTGFLNLLARAQSSQPQWKARILSYDWSSRLLSNEWFWVAAILYVVLFWEANQRRSSRQR